MVFDKMHNAVKCSVHRTAVLVGVAIILHTRRFLIFRNVQSVTYKLVYALVF